MRFSTILASFALVAGFVAANPLVDRDSTDLKGVDASLPNYDDVTPGGPSPNGDSDESSGEVVAVGGGKTVSKRDDYNPLDARALPILILCARRGCKGYCYGYNLSAARFNQCYLARHPYYSVYVSYPTGLGYGAYVGRHSGRYCRGMQIFSLFNPLF